MYDSQWALEFLKHIKPSIIVCDPVKNHQYVSADFMGAASSLDISIIFIHHVLDVIAIYLQRAK